MPLIGNETHVYTKNFNTEGEAAEFKGFITSSGKDGEDSEVTYRKLKDKFKEYFGRIIEGKEFKDGQTFKLPEDQVKVEGSKVRVVLNENRRESDSNVYRLLMQMNFKNETLKHARPKGWVDNISNPNDKGIGNQKF